MSGDAKRTYVSPLRAAAAAGTRSSILSAARAEFEQRGWAATTLPRVAARAGVSPKTIQAQFGTKARLLADTVDFAVRGAPGSGSPGQQGAARAIRAAGTAPEALRLHAAMAAAINARVARLAAVVEAGAQSDPAVVPLWERMRESMRFAVRWAAETTVTKPGLRSGLTLDELETVLQVAMAWSTFRTLASTRGMTPSQIEAWLGVLYERMLLSRVTSAGSLPPARGSAPGSASL